MIAGKDDHRAVAKAQSIERIEDYTDLLVHEGDAGVVGLQCFAALRIGHFVLFFFAAGQARTRDVLSVFFDIGDEGEFVRIVKLEIFFGGDVGSVRPKEAESEEEGFVPFLGEAFEDPDGVPGLHGIGMLRRWCRGRVPAQGTSELLRDERGDIGFLQPTIDACGVEFEFPAGRVIVTVGPDGAWDVVVIHFADATGEVIGAAKCVWQASLSGNGLPEDLAVVVDAGAVGIEAGEDRIAAGAAQRKRAIGSIESRAAGGEPVDVGGYRQRIPVAAETIVQVVGDDEEHIFGTVRARSGYEQEGSNKPEEHGGWGSHR